MNELQEFQDIQEIQDRLNHLLNADESGIGKRIDQFDTNKFQDINALVNYWNESIKKFYQGLWEIKNNLSENKEYNAAKYYMAPSKEKQYVVPFTNKNGENYLDTREDEIEKVLNEIATHGDTKDDSAKADYTNRQIDSYTRLIMPRYPRNVEVEDFDRNFWVIGQNITLLNELMLQLNDNILKNLIAELCGIWDNIYRIWQAIIQLSDEIKDFKRNNKPKVRINITEAVNGQTSHVYIKGTDSFVTIENLSPFDNRSEEEIRSIITERNYVLIYSGIIENKKIWDLYSLTFVKEGSPTFGQNSNNLQIKTKKFENIWVEFYHNDNDSTNIITSYTENNFDNILRADPQNDGFNMLSYNVELTIPFYKNYVGRYYDFIRLNKPFPVILTDNSSIQAHVESMNNQGNWTHGEDNGSLYWMDGFYLCSMKNIYEIQIASSDMIDCLHPFDGQTDKYNKHLPLERIILNLRYINGRQNSQEVELVTTKDLTLQPIKYTKIVNAATEDIGMMNLSNDTTKVSFVLKTMNDLGEEGTKTYHIDSDPSKTYFLTSFDQEDQF